MKDFPLGVASFSVCVWCVLPSFVNVLVQRHGFSLTNSFDTSVCRAVEKILPASSSCVSRHFLSYVVCGFFLLLVSFSFLWNDVRRLRRLQPNMFYSSNWQILPLNDWIHLAIASTQSNFFVWKGDWVCRHQVAVSHHHQVELEAVNQKENRTRDSADSYGGRSRRV